MRIEDKVAIITGAARGIGEGIATALAREGVKVILADIEEELAESVSQNINETGGISESIKLDVTNAVEIELAIQKVLSTYSHIDILVNNAGINLPTPILEMSEEAWDRVVAVNLKGVFLCSRAVAKIMVKQGSGKIINISSVAGKISAPGLGPYCASKRGVLGLTEVLAIELGKYGICVNAICPGNIETEMIVDVLSKRAEERGQTFEKIVDRISNNIPLSRIGKPQDIAELVVFLASSRSDYITGQAINVCGGRSINLS